MELTPKSVLYRLSLTMVVVLVPLSTLTCRHAGPRASKRRIRMSNILNIQQQQAQVAQGPAGPAVTAVRQSGLGTATQQQSHACW